MDFGWRAYSAIRASLQQTIDVVVYREEDNQGWESIVASRFASPFASDLPIHLEVCGLDGAVSQFPTPLHSCLFFLSFNSHCLQLPKAAAEVPAPRISVNAAISASAKAAEWRAGAELFPGNPDKTAHVLAREADVSGMTKGVR